MHPLINMYAVFVLCNMWKYITVDLLHLTKYQNSLLVQWYLITQKGSKKK